MKTPIWEIEIYSFIQEWLNKRNHIVVKTSGSTGKPKLIELKKDWVAYSAQQTCNFFHLNYLSTALLCLPVAFIGGKMMIVRSFISGLNLLLSEPLGNPFQNIKEKIDFSAITPFQLYKSLDNLKNNPLVKSIIVGGGEISPSLEKEVQDLPIDIYATYGMTETSSHIALRRVNGSEREDYYTVIGHTTISHDDRGCLTIENPNLFDGKLITNDLVEVVDTNKFRWLGRYDNIINSGGIKIIPEEIEQSIANLLPQALVISSISDEKLSEAVVLVVESDELPIEEKDSLLSQIKELVHPYAVPKQIFNLPQLPKTPTGKVDRSILKNIITTI